MDYEGVDKVAFDKMWNSCHEKVEANTNIAMVRKEYTEIIEGLQGIRNELIKRIQEPWKV